MYNDTQIIMAENMRREMERRIEAEQVAYKQKFLPYMMDILGVFFNFGVHHLGYNLPLWVGLFAHSGLARYFCSAGPALEGNSAMYMAIKIDNMYRGNDQRFFPKIKPQITDMPCYEAIDGNVLSILGRRMAWLQWYSNIDFVNMIARLPVADALRISEDIPADNDLDVYLFTYEFEAHSRKRLSNVGDAVWN